MIDGNERTALYRMFDADGVLLYVGISNSFGRRWTRHAATQPWWGDVQRQTVDWYPSRPEAEAAEKTAIRTEDPKYNIAHAVRPPWPEQDVTRRLVCLVASEPGEGGYEVKCPDIFAPGTYQITFAYDRDAEASEAVAVSKCVLLEGGDSVSRLLGGKVRPMADADPNAPSGRISPEEALARAV